MIDIVITKRILLCVFRIKIYVNNILNIHTGIVKTCT
jgi:hypothetical protein